MSSLNKILITLAIVALIFGAGIVFAQEEEAMTTSTEEVRVEDLGVKEANILPDSPFYFLKEWGRNIQSFFAFNSVKKAKLKEKFANEKLIEIKQMVKQNKNRERIESAIQNYQKELGEMERATKRIRERVEESEQASKFLDKFIQQQALHQRILEKLQEQVPAEVYEKIAEARKLHLEKFGQVMTKLETKKEELQKRLEKNLQEVPGNEFKEFKNLEILKGLEEKVPEEAKEVIQRAQENALKRLKENLEKMSPDDQARFKEYINSIIGDKEIQMEILDSLKEQTKITPQLKENLLQIRENVMNRIRERSQTTTAICPKVEKPIANFCVNGRVIIDKDDKGCVLGFKCVVPAENEEKNEEKNEEVTSPQPTTSACISVWDPVCGKDGKTYSNACYIKKAGVDIAYDGVCELTTREREQNEGEEKSIQNRLKVGQ